MNIKQSQNPDIKTILSQKDLDNHNDFLQKRFEEINSEDVERILSGTQGTYSLDKLLTLISPAAENYLEAMAQLSKQLTIQRFGRTIRLYAPLYLSNYCVNSCLYCGYNKNNKIEHRRLSLDEALAQADIIAAEGFRDILLVSGEDKKFIDVDYLIKLAGKLRDKFSFISIEIYQLTAAEYKKLFEAGIEGVTLYQETYNRNAYAHYHVSGPKADYDERLSTPDKIASAGMREIGVGVLLGLADWQAEISALGEHVHYIAKRYWQSHISISFPRLRPAQSVNRSQFTNLISDKNLVQMILALRLCFADVGLVLSTRESAELRDQLINLGITKMSAGSKTNPGGYTDHAKSANQFEVHDTRTPAEVASMIKTHGFDPVYKDWDSVFLKA
jgi:2-iminoacetate synthase